jgi:hypothetical protein
MKTTTMTSAHYSLKKIKSPATTVTYKQSLNQFKEATGFNLTDKKKTKGKGTPEESNQICNTIQKEWRFIFSY